MRQLNIPSTIEQIATFIKTSVHSTGFKKCIVAVSGGVDSATSISLATKALGKENVYALLLPFKDWHEEAKAHARLVLKQLEIPEKNIHEVDIAPMVDAFSSTFNFQLSTLDKFRLGNIMARVRMIVLFDLAKKLNALVIGTENKSEHYLGYYTRFGDEASDLEPLRNIYKTEVYSLAKHLGVPQEIITKAPTAGLWQGQTDEGELGFTYKEADEILWGLYGEKLTTAELMRRGMKRKTIEKVQQWVKQVSFKHYLPIIAPEP